MSHNPNRPMQRRGNYGGAGGIARPDAKMSRRKRTDWPYFNLWSYRQVGDPDPTVTTGMRQTLKQVSRKKRRQRDRITSRT